MATANGTKPQITRREALAAGALSLPVAALLPAAPPKPAQATPPTLAANLPPFVGDASAARMVVLAERHTSGVYRLAELSGVDLARLRDWYAGHDEPRTDDLVRIASAIATEDGEATQNGTALAMLGLDEWGGDWWKPGILKTQANAARFYRLLTYSDTTTREICSDSGIRLQIVRDWRTGFAELRADAVGPLVATVRRRLGKRYSSEDLLDYVCTGEGGPLADARRSS